ncbi:hypothetical protein BC940DRAFT_244105 [Gongronella butleri]|nr:hypothetical protein BC940DRAFT_244105 [Gongronella butleri]
MAPAPLRIASGVYVPIPNFFLANEDLDFEALEKHIAFLSNKGLAGLVIMGSSGEAVHLTDDERVQVVQHTKKFVEKYDPSLTIIAGTGSGSVRATLKLTKDAAAAGAQYAMVLPPSYYVGSMDDQAHIDFFERIADESPIPIIIYNYPGVTQGIDLSEAVIAKLAQHKNIAAIKGTDGNIGKVGGLAIKTEGTGFNLLAGSTNFALPALTVGSQGSIVGLGNLLPKSCVLLQTLYEQGKHAEAVKLQQQLVEPDNVLCRYYGLPGIKGGLDSFNNYGGPSRCPLREVSDEVKAKIAKAFEAAIAYEKTL